MNAEPKSCYCSVVWAGSTRVGREWRASCPEHGNGSDWYVTAGRQRLTDANDRAVVMQAFAALSRNGQQELAQHAKAAFDRLTRTPLDTPKENQ